MQIPVTGWYVSDARVSFQGPAVASVFNAHHYVNNVIVNNRGSFERSTSSTGKGHSTLFMNYYFTAGDWVKLMIRNESNNNDVIINAIDWIIKYDE